MTTVVWHDLECGRYCEDLPLWQELVSDHLRPGESVLDVGAGTGRVTLPLARAGHRVTALDRDPVLLQELERRGVGLSIEIVCADARDFELPGREFGMVIVPMQTIQLLGGPAGHAAFLSCASAHLTAGGLIVVAIAACENFEEFELQDGGQGPLPDITEIDGRAYFSQPTAVRRTDNTFVLERRRDVVELDGARTSSDDVIALDVLSVEAFVRTAHGAGLRIREQLRVEPTDEHIGSEVVVLGA